MSFRNDRVGELIEGIKRKPFTLLTPEGVTFDLQIAGRGERLGALGLDLFFMSMAISALYILLIPLFYSNANLDIGLTLILFLAFIVRILYFLHFELAWQGRTPGKRILGLRVIDRRGGELLPSSIIARNLTREVEIFLPISLLLSVNPETGLQKLILLGWVLTVTALPFFNREHLRAGDLIGGTIVIAMPKRSLLKDLALMAIEKQEQYTFTHEQLAVYGIFELQVLEELLRRPENRENRQLLEEVCQKICNKIAWEEPVTSENVRSFLNAFYAAERGDLERAQLFGKMREDKTSQAHK